ncbi:MAG: single-stranded DNA-binding protein [Coriobacteriaceae bacterium]|nr:single-stranded DNA-binding protein [Coriobacteriaceae bacterium]MCI6843370.1 single-stranded DNA-binding protein [Coriobacteriaceae bacterium]
MRSDVNIAVLAGNATSAPRVYSKDGAARALFTIAVARRGRGGGKAGTDFVRCVAFGHTAEALAKSLGKGDRTMVTGPIRVWHKVGEDGASIERTEVLVVTAEVHKRADQPVNVQAAEGATSAAQAPSAGPGGAVAGEGIDNPEDMGQDPSASLASFLDEDEEALLDALADSWSGD